MQILPLVLPALLACKPEQSFGRVETTDTFVQEPTNEVDILWVVDNSPSMAEEQAEVARRFEQFVSNVASSNADFHIGVVTTDMESSDHRGKLQGDPLYLTPEDDYIPLFQQNVQVGTSGARYEKGIDAAYQALSEPLVSGYNAGFRRPGATLSIIYVSDENDCTDRGALAGQTSNTACTDNPDLLVDVRELIDDYKTLATRDERLVVSAIVGPSVDVGCNGSVPGLRYLAMAEAFGGLKSSICEADFSRIMIDLSLEVSGVRTAFQLTHEAVEETIEVVVDDAVVEPDPDNGWTYDPAYWIVYFHGDGIPPRGSTINITYEIGSGSAAPPEGTTEG